MPAMVTTVALADKPSGESDDGLCDISYTEFTIAVDDVYHQHSLVLALPMWATRMDPTGKEYYVYSVKAVQQVTSGAPPELTVTTSLV